MIYDITGPFNAKSNSPAWQAGIRDGDRLALSTLRCFPYTHTTCRNALMVLGGFQLVLPGREAMFDLKATSEHPAGRSP